MRAGHIRGSGIHFSIPVSFALAVAAAVLLAPGAARAQADACGDLTSANSYTATCSATATFNTISYDSEANSATVTVTGHSSGTTITSSASWWSGIVIRTNTHASNPHNIALTVGGGGGGSVTIAQAGSTASSWYANRGIFVMQRTPNSSTTRINVRSGVTIGSSGTKMKSHGIHARVDTGVTGAGEISVTSAATIYSEDDAIKVDNPGGGAVTVTNSGAITTDARGIYINETGSGGAVTVINSGAITSASTTSHEGIYARTIGKDSAGANAGVSVTHSAGAISVTGGGAGIKAFVGTARQEADAMHANYVAPMNTGLAKVSVTGGSITSYGHAINAENLEAGGVEIDVSEGVMLTSTRDFGIVANLTDVGNTSGTISVTNAGTVKAGTLETSVQKDGIYAARAAGAGAVTVINRGPIEANGDGIDVRAGGGGGAIAVTNSGAIGTATDEVFLGINVAHTGTGGSIEVRNNGGALTTTDGGIRVDARDGTTAVTVVNSGAILTDDESRGIYVTVNDGAGAVTVENSGAIGSATARARIGVDVYHQAGTGYVTVTNSGDVMTSRVGVRGFADTGSNANLTIVATGSATGGAVVTDGFDVAVSAVHSGASGKAAVRVMDGATIVSKRSAGVDARLNHSANVGRLSVAQGGAISGRTGVRAFVRRGSEATETRAASAQPLIDVTWTGTFACGTGTYECGTATARDETGRVSVSSVASAVLNARAIDLGNATRYLEAAGVEAFALDPWNVAEVIARGDAPAPPGDAISATQQGNLLSETRADSRRAAIVAQFRSILTNDEFAMSDDAETEAGTIDADNDNEYSEAEIVDYLDDNDVTRRATLQSVLAANLSEKETAVLRAVVSGSDADLDAALDDTDAGFSAAYKTAVKALRNRFNVGNIRVAVNSGSIDSRGDGVRAYYVTPHNSNGRIDVTVAEGATVTGAVAGVYAANAGMGAVAGWEGASALPDSVNMTTTNLRQQFVTVHGAVTGGTDAAVHLSGGGALLVGERGSLVAGDSGRAILVNDPGRSEIVIHGAVRGGAGPDESDDTAAIDVTGGGTVVVGATGSVDAMGADYAIRASRASADDTRTTQIVYLVPAVIDDRVPGTITQEAADLAVARVDGAIGGNGVADGRALIAAVDDEGTTGATRHAAIVNGRAVAPTGLPRAPTPDEDGMEEGEDDTPTTDDRTPGTGEDGTPGDERPTGEGTGETSYEAPEPFMCDMASDGRCRLYSALPSALLSMNGLPTYEERLAATRNAAGGWARMETSRGDWEADSSTRAGVAWDGRRSGVRVGVDGAASDDLRVGVSAHGMRGSADVTQNGGKVEMSGFGASVSGTAFAGDGVYVDAQAAATRYEVKLTSRSGRTLKDGAKGVGYALAVEAGRAVALDDSVTVTPRAGFSWSRVSMSDFTDPRAVMPVSVEEATSLVGRAGLSVAVSPGGAGGLRVIGSAEATHEFEGETETRIDSVSLKASSETTGARFSLGAAHGWDDDRFALQASASYATGGSAGDGFGGGLSLSVRF